MQCTTWRISTYIPTSGSRYPRCVALLHLSCPRLECAFRGEDATQCVSRRSRRLTNPKKSRVVRRVAYSVRFGWFALTNGTRINLALPTRGSRAARNLSCGINTAGYWVTPAAATTFKYSYMLERCDKSQSVTYRKKPRERTARTGDVDSTWRLRCSSRRRLWSTGEKARRLTTMLLPWPAFENGSQ